MARDGNLGPDYIKTDGTEVKKGIPTDILYIVILILSVTLAFALGYLAKGEGGMQGSEVPWIENAGTTSASVAGENLTASALSGYTKSTAKVAPASAPAPKANVPLIPVPEGEMYVASKNGTAYYLPWCGGVKNIKEENRTWFASKAEAEAKGYHPAKNCKGI